MTDYRPNDFRPARSWLADPNDPWPAPTAYERHRARVRRRILLGISFSVGVLVIGGRLLMLWLAK